MPRPHGLKLPCIRRRRTNARRTALPTDAGARDLVLRFCERVHRLVQIHFTYSQLAGNEQARPLMQKTANSFFRQINGIVIDYFLLEVAKLTDPARSGAASRENFTVANLSETIDWPPQVLRELRRPMKILNRFRGFIATARNRLLAHYDKDTVLGGRPLGAFPHDEDTKALRALEHLCNTMHQCALGTIYGEMDRSEAGDVLDLKRALRSAIAFDKLLNESTGEDLMRLMALLEENDLATPPRSSQASW